ncbi:MAG: guanylate kinase [Tissierellales bacterium]|jgi:guanylate kinase|nr:guanylate kinase [Tissierellales bacterium]MBN2827687.1 guanylate kinase [Tissierellales bacterium]
MDQGLLIVISGPSGAGKGTICKSLLEKLPDMKVSVSVTTRKPRNQELEGINYFFTTKAAFEEKINHDEFLEYAQVYGNYYGTPKWKVLELINNGKDVILEIDIQGALKVKEKYPEGVFIFILPPSLEELKKRITDRGTESKEDIIRRLDCTYEELSFAFKYDYLVMNDYVENAVSKISAIITAEKSKAIRQIALINKIRED